MTRSADDGDSGHTVFRPSPLQARKPAGEAQANTVSLVRLRDDRFPKPESRVARRHGLVEAAAPILGMITAVRAGRAQLSFAQLHHHALDAADQFNHALERLDLGAEGRDRARYGLFATLDDIAQNLPGGGLDGGEWARRSLVVRAFGENIGGDRFFTLLDEMLRRPADHVELIGLYHACLVAGFEGRHRVSAEGARGRAQIAAQAFAALPHDRRVTSGELSPAWRGADAPQRRLGPFTPLTIAAAAAAVLALAVVSGLRLVLMQTGQPSMEALSAMSPSEPLRLSRLAAPPRVQDDPRSARLRAFLAPEIAQGLVVIVEDAASVRVRMTSGELFRSGSDRVEPQGRALVSRIAHALVSESGAVRVEGHADADAIASLAFPNNVALSRARAEQVARLINDTLDERQGISAEGFGATRPLASNATAEGKRRNRRVEIVLERSA